MLVPCRRLMKGMGLQGIIRGKPHRTTIPDKKVPCPLDKVNRQFRAPGSRPMGFSNRQCQGELGHGVTFGTKAFSLRDISAGLTVLFVVATRHTMALDSLSRSMWCPPSASCVRCGIRGNDLALAFVPAGTNPRGSVCPGAEKSGVGRGIR